MSFALRVAPAARQVYAPALRFQPACRFLSTSRRVCSPLLSGVAGPRRVAAAAAAGAARVHSSAATGVAAASPATKTAPAWTISPSHVPGVSLLSLDAPPVNALTREVIKELITRLTMLRGSEGVKAVVLTSRRPGVFSAGLNIRELYRPDKARLREYL